MKSMASRICWILFACLVALVALAGFAEPTRTTAMTDYLHGANYRDGERSADLITPEMVLAAKTLLGTRADEILYSVRLTMNKYDNDMRSDSGRANWHGRLINQIYDTNNYVKVSVYSNTADGVVWRYQEYWRPSRAKNGKKTAEELARKKAERRAQNLSRTTNNVPPELAAAMKATLEFKDGVVSNVTVRTDANAAPLTP